VHLENASFEIEVTLLGIVTLAREVHPENAQLPILVTVTPPIVEGISTAPPGPL
jgi:hypothetical protein